MFVCSEVNRCYDEAEKFHASFVGQTQAKEAYLDALRTVSPNKIIDFVTFVQGDDENKLSWLSL